MRRVLFTSFGLLLLSILGYAQQFNWQEIDKPYFVYDTKGDFIKIFIEL